MQGEHTNSNSLRIAGAAVALILAVGVPTVTISRWSASIEARSDVQSTAIKQLAEQVSRVADKVALVADNLDRRTAQYDEMKAMLREAVTAAEQANAQFDEMSQALNDAKRAAQQTTAISKDTNATGKKVRVEVGSLEWRVRMLEEAHRRLEEKKQ